LRSVPSAQYICGSVLEYRCSTVCAVRPTSGKRNFLSRQTQRLMARRDDLTGKGPVAGNHVSHAHNKAKRRFEINIQKKRFYIPEEDRWVTLKVSAKTIKTINKKGISAVLKDARANGINV